MKTKLQLAALALLLSTLIPQHSTCFAQGSLTPPGPPAPTMKTLQQVEPRAPISSLPFTITNSGSYYLTTNLIGPAFTAGITIQSNVPNVTLDLNGFALVGGTSGLLAIDGTIFPGTNLVVRNGSIQNWASGVSAGRLCRMERLQIWNCPVFGISVLDDSVVRECAIVNCAAGVAVGVCSLIEDCLVSSNANPQIITVLSGSTVTRCTVMNNLGTGIFANGSSCCISGCRLIGNSLDGIRISGQSLVEDNVVSGTGNALGTNACIHAALSGNRIDGNQVSSHQIGIRVDNTNNLVIRNSAFSNGTNYFIPNANQVGPINSGTGALTNNPWANFSL